MIKDRLQTNTIRRLTAERDALKARNEELVETLNLINAIENLSERSQGLLEQALAKNEGKP